MLRKSKQNSIPNENYHIAWEFSVMFENFHDRWYKKIEILAASHDMGEKESQWRVKPHVIVTELQ